MDIIKDDRFKNIYLVDVFGKEYQKMFGKSKQLYHTELEHLAKNLYILDDRMTSALQLQQFEALKGHDQLCSIRHVSESNPRVIFVFAEIESAVVLLSCTLEKSKDDYDKAVKRAKERLSLLEEEG